jgi:hypothetical protein
MKDFPPTVWRCDVAEIERNRELRADEPYIPKDCDDRFFRGLTSKDFYLQEDDAQETVQSVVLERSPIVDVRDNFGHHVEQSSTPTAKWSASDIPYLVVPDSRYVYRLAYTPPKSSEGSCHHVRVVVNRPDSVVFARSQYCNVKNAPGDQLLGTAFGKRLETLAGSLETGKLSVWLQAGFFHADESKVRVNVALDFPWDSLKRKWIKGSLNATIGVIGLVYSQDARIVARFTDFGCCSPDVPNFAATNRLQRDAFPELDVLRIPTRYETQIYVPPGNYDLRIVISDDSNFGRVSVPLNIEPVEANQLAISSVMLCKRFRNAAVAAQEAAGVNLAPQYVPLVSKGMQFTPGGDTRFRKGEHLVAYYEVYDPLLATQPGLALATRLKITNTKTGEVQVDTGMRNATGWTEPGKTTIPIAQQVAAEKLPRGSYRLEVQASDSARRSTVWRAANFTVE